MRLLALLTICIVWDVTAAQRCTSNSCYHFFGNELLTWDEAERSCISKGLHLAPASDELDNILWSHSDLHGPSYWADIDNNPHWHFKDQGVYAGYASSSFSGEGTQCGLLEWDAALNTYFYKPAPCSTQKGILCETDYPIECLISNIGSEYKGTKSRTSSSITCAQWEGRFVSSLWEFPDSKLSEVKNYCRNPNANPIGPWCGISSSHNPGAMDFCPLPSCVESNSCFNAEQITTNSVWCINDKCYVIIPENIAGSKTWLDATTCCSTFTSGRLASIDPSHQTSLLQEVALRFPGASLWTSLTNGDWTTDTSQPDVILCPYMKRGFTQHSNTFCTIRQGYVCREDAVPSVTTTLKQTVRTTPTTTTTTTTTRKPTTTSTTTTTTTTTKRPTTTSTTTTTRRPPPPTTTTLPTTTTTTPTTTTSTTSTTTTPATTTTTTIKPQVKVTQPARNSSSSTTTTTTPAYNKENVVAAVSVLPGDNVLYLGIGLAAAIVLVALILIALLIFFRRTKNGRPRTLLSRQRSTSGTQTFPNGDFENENGAPIATSSQTQTSSSRPTIHSISVPQPPPKRELERSSSTDSATQTDLTPLYSTVNRKTLPLPLPPKENIYNHVYDRPRPLTCRPK